jgi:hypothetical protein
MKYLVSKLFIAAIFLVSTGAQATLLTGGLTVDNAFQAYISTDDNVQGALIGSGTHWPTTSVVNTSLTAGQNYFLHIDARDYINGVSALLGDFSLSGSDHLFSNGSNFVTTNTTDWSVSTTGWSGYGAVNHMGNNGISPWGLITDVDSSADWIWSNDQTVGNHAYFTLSINAATVPEPSILALMCLGIFGIGFARRRRQS